jgi:phosphoribosyl 1,2-cyclic phosphodiesterase
VGYRFYLQGHSIATMTDLGYFSEGVRRAVQGAEVVLLESNHDPKLLEQNPNYPGVLKRRILGNHGHLSNESGAKAAVELVKAGTRHLLLGHLSPENNTEELAYSASRAALTAEGIKVGQDVSLYVAGRFTPSFLYRIP